MAQFKKRVFGANVPYDVQMDFQKLASGGINRTKIRDKEGNPIILKGKGAALEQINPSFENYLGDKTPFTRMWCAVNINTLDETPPDGQLVERHVDGYYFYYKNPKDKEKSEITKIGHDSNSHTRVFVVNENTEESHVNNNPLNSIQSTGMKSLQQITQLQHNPLMKPSAGITSVTSKTQGALGALQNTTVEFVVHNKKDFEEIFLPYFLKPGSIVCVDYGWSDIANSLYNPIDQIKDKPLDMSEFDEFIYGKNGFLARNYGKVNTTMGNVVSYEANITTEGSYNCSLEIVSRNASLLDKEISDDNKLTFVFSNSINDILIDVLSTAAGVSESLSLQQMRESNDTMEDLDEIDLTRKFFTNVSDVMNPQGAGRIGLGKIGILSSKTGIFHQDMYANVDSNQNYHAKTIKLGNQEEETYISYGLFEDLFLTNFVAGTIPTEPLEDDKGNKNSISFTKNPSRDFSNRFDSRTSYIRWDQDLNLIPKQKLGANEGLSSFIIPDSWEGEDGDGNEYKSYNCRTLGDEFVSTDDCIKGNHPDYPGIAVMPLRDLFIKTELISEAFKKKSTVNDVVIFILDKLNLDSQKIWNLKISSDMSSQAVIKITDTNLNPEISKEEDMLIFNVMGETSIVSQCDLKFTTPKAGLSSMIAIGNLHGPQRFEQLDLSALNNLNLLNKPEEKKNLPTIVKSLPLQGVPNKQMTRPAADLDLSSFVRQNNFNIIDDSLQTKIQDSYKVYRLDVLRRLEQEPEKKDDKKKIHVKNLDGFNYTKSDRDYYKERIRIKYYDQSAVDRVAPVLPLELTLSVYGNRFLQIGDYFTINYLPSYYKDKIFFQIFGIEDKIDVNGWTTSYQPAQMRVKPDQKESITGKPKIPDTVVSYEENPLLGARPDGGIVHSYTIGAKPYPFAESRHRIQAESSLKHIIMEKSKWKPLSDAGMVAKSNPNLFYFHNVKSDTIRITDLINLCFSCAVRDVLLSKEFSPFNPSNIVQSSYKLVGQDEGVSQEKIVNDYKGQQKANPNKMVFLEFIDQRGIMNSGGRLLIGEDQKAEIAIADAIQSMCPKPGDNYYVVDDKDMFVDVDVVQRVGRQSTFYKVPKFIQHYGFPINATDAYENKIQHLFEIKFQGVDVFKSLYLPEHLLKRDNEGKVIASVEEFLQNLRNKFDEYFNKLEEQIDRQQEEGRLPDMPEFRRGGIG